MAIPGAMSPTWLDNTELFSVPFHLTQEKELSLSTIREKCCITCSLLLVNRKIDWKVLSIC